MSLTWANIADMLFGAAMLLLWTVGFDIHDIIKSGKPVSRETARRIWEETKCRKS